ncbi:hypothetical protein WJX75_002801 [Coccomyxa subellipsoidea]|uniref:EGF-like domain-containing protein n=1 Tax=Coccomyxa subellipsoidea TaxID=248742 RepID=A0ABR2Z287_9CHLO
MVGVSGDSNATADSAFFLRSPVYTESLNAVQPFVGANSLIAPQVCQPGTFGRSCTLPTNCNNNGATNPSDGSCVCFAPYTGQFCNDTVTTPMSIASSTPMMSSTVPSTTLIPTTAPVITTPPPTTSCIPGNSNTFINVDNVDQAGSLIVAVNASSSGDCHGMR